MSTINPLDADLLAQVASALQLRRDIHKSVKKWGTISVHSTSISLRFSVRNSHTDNGKAVVAAIKTAVGGWLDKKDSSSGFLIMYFKLPNGLRVIINTAECFHGGLPIIEKYPRTKAHCPTKGDVE